MSARVATRRFSALRIALFRAFERVCAACGGRWIYRRRHLAPGRLVARHEEVRVNDATGSVEGYRVAVLSDFHAGSFLGPGGLAHALDIVARFEPDAVCLLGDFIVHAVEEFDGIADDLAQLRARDGVFCVFGNHDYKGRLEAHIVERLARTGGRFLRNEAARCERVPSLVFVGIEDAEEGRVVDPERARAALRPGDVELALTHNPQAARAFLEPSPAGRGAAVVLAGHSHGTQVDLPVLRGLGPAHPGLRVEFGATTLLVTRGVGVVGVPLRVGAPAEVLCLTLRA
ncbi:MAG: metallophosphoesterase family protein [Planctomycetota bacterium]